MRISRAIVSPVASRATSVRRRRSAPGTAARRAGSDRGSRRQRRRAARRAACPPGPRGRRAPCAPAESGSRRSLGRDREAAPQRPGGTPSGSAPSSSTSSVRNGHPGRREMHGHRRLAAARRAGDQSTPAPLSGSITARAVQLEAAALPQRGRQRVGDEPGQRRRLERRAGHRSRLRRRRDPACRSPPPTVDVDVGRAAVGVARAAAGHVEGGQPGGNRRRRRAAPEDDGRGRVRVDRLGGPGSDTSRETGRRCASADQASRASTSSDPPAT